ncbi:MULTISPECIES: hypothetical protein [Chitinophagaceae]
MKTSHKFIVALIVSMSGMSACRPKTDIPTPSNGGKIDVSNYVAIGNSITSGFADAALYMEGQEVSYPNLLSQQFKTIGGGDFKQPLTPPNTVGIGSTANAKLVLQVVNGSLTPVPAAAAGDMSIWTTSVAADGPFNNMGVPGAKAITTVYPGYGNPANGTGSYNPFFTRMTTNPQSASILSDAAAQKPTFFSLFIGNNDVLAYALAGGASDAITPSAGPAGVGFDASIDAIVGTMMQTATTGVVANIPDITSIPYFTYIPYNALVLTRQGQVDSLTAGYQTANAGLKLMGLDTIRFVLGANPFVIKDASIPVVGVRQMKQGELVLLGASTNITTQGGGSASPLADQYVLTATEVNNIKTATTAYNAKLKAVADAKDLAFVDVAAFMSQAKTGFVQNGRSVSATFVTGGAFSLDGIHLTPLGNAMLANEFIKAINSKYGSTVPQIDATLYSGVKFP